MIIHMYNWCYHLMILNASPSMEDPLEKGMTIHSSILSWRIAWTEEPGGLHSPWGHKESDVTEHD